MTCFCTSKEYLIRADNSNYAVDITIWPYKHLWLYNHLMSTPNGVPTEQAPSIDICSLSYAFPDGSSGLHNVNISLPPGSRTLLIGGKSFLIHSQVMQQGNCTKNSCWVYSKWRWQNHTSSTLVWQTHGPYVDYHHSWQRSFQRRS